MAWEWNPNRLRLHLHKSMQWFDQWKSEGKKYQRQFNRWAYILWIKLINICHFGSKDSFIDRMVVKSMFIKDCNTVNNNPIDQSVDRVVGRKWTKVYVHTHTHTDTLTHWHTHNPWISNWSRNTNVDSPPLFFCTHRHRLKKEPFNSEIWNLRWQYSNLLIQ